MVALKTLIFTVFVPGTVTVLVPYSLLSAPSQRFSVDFGPLRWFGLVPLLLGVVGYFWCAWDFTFRGKGTPAPTDPPKELVVSGPYRFVRNPMYVAVLLVVSGEALAFASATLLAYAALLFLGFHLFVVFYEERTLRRKFGEAYARYCIRVPRWVPRVRALFARRE